MTVKARYTIDTYAETRDALSKLAKMHKLTQGEVLDVLLKVVDMSKLTQQFDEARKKKVEEREQRNDLNRLLRKYSREELEAMLGQRGDKVAPDA